MLHVREPSAIHRTGRVSARVPDASASELHALEQSTCAANKTGQASTSTPEVWMLRARGPWPSVYYWCVHNLLLRGRARGSCTVCRLRVGAASVPCVCSESGAAGRALCANRCSGCP
jgi:hypothetical protein